MKLQVNPSAVLLFIGLVAIFSLSMNMSTAIAASTLVLASLVLHELGHVLVAVVHGVPVREVGIRFLGAFTIRQHSGSRMVEVQSALAGPAVNLILAAILTKIPGEPWQMMSAINLVLGVTNLIPIRPADGWKVWKELTAPADSLQVFPALNK